MSNWQEQNLLLARLRFWKPKRLLEWASPNIDSLVSLWPITCSSLQPKPFCKQQSKLSFQRTSSVEEILLNFRLSFNSIKQDRWSPRHCPDTTKIQKLIKSEHKGIRKSHEKSVILIVGCTKKDSYNQELKSWCKVNFLLLLSYFWTTKYFSIINIDYYVSCWVQSTVWIQPTCLIKAYLRGCLQKSSSQPKLIYEVSSKKVSQSSSMWLLPIVFKSAMPLNETSLRRV